MTLTRDDYQRRLDLALDVLPEERAWIAAHGTLPPRLRDAMRSRSLRRTALVVGVLVAAAVVLTVLAVAGVSTGKMEPLPGLLPVVCIVPILLLLPVVSIWRFVQDGRAFGAGQVRVYVGLLEGSILRGKGPPTCTVKVADSEHVHIPHAAYEQLALGHPHRLYVVPGTIVVAALEVA